MGKDSKKHKKKHKKEKKHKSKQSTERKKKYSTDSSESSGSEGDWVEKEPSTPSVTKSAPKERDQWMSMETIFSGKTRTELNENKKKPEKEKEFNLLDKPGQSTRELNPFWKNGGTGLPPEEEQEPRKKNLHYAHSDKKSKRRYSSDSESSDDNSENSYVVSSNSESSEDKPRNKHTTSSKSSDYKRRDEKDSWYRREKCDEQSYVYKDRKTLNLKRSNESSKTSYVVSSESESSEEEPRHRKKDTSSSRSNKEMDYRDSKFRGEERKKLNFKRPDDDSFSVRSKHVGRDDTYKKFNFKKPDEESVFNEKVHRSADSSSGRKNWKKPISEDQRKFKSASERFSSEQSQDSPNRSRDFSPKPELKQNDSKPDEILSLNEMNELSASILKAELMGNKGLAEELKAKLKQAREAKEDKSSCSEIYDEKGRKVVILTETNSKGFTGPAKGMPEDKYQSRKNKKVKTHEQNQRVRYFADDDKYSLNDMFVNEKYTTSDDQIATFMKLSNKQSWDEEDSALDVARLGDEDKEDRKKHMRAIKKQIAKERALDGCKYCIGNKDTSSDCIVLSKDKVYLAVPHYQSLTDGHCLIVPQYHISCATMVDEDIWDEIMDLRKKLVRIFEKEDQDVIFFESAMYINKHPHMIIHCVPVPKEIGDTAPIYFKKAILECENEWTTNKKVVELSGRDVRKAVPKGLPYFFVDFGLQSGYAHVIEDKLLFPNNFAQEIIGGMMDLDHSKWRKPKTDTTEKIKSKVKSLKELIGDE